MKKTLSFRILSLLFALVFLVTALPLGIFANDVETTEEAAAANEELTATVSEGVSLLPTGYEDEPTFPEEIQELRTENVKHFDKGDGTYEAIAYGGAVHRKDADGKWQDIDNTLTLREDRGAERYVDADARISFAPAASSGTALWQLSENGYSISLSLADADLRAGAVADVKNHTTRAEQIAAATKADDTNALFRVDNSTKILYRNVLANVDLEYILSGNDVKETIIVQNVCENYDFPFRLSLSGLIPKTTESGAILLCDAESGKEVYLLPAPYMTDANDDYSDAVSYRLIDLGEGEYEIIVSASDEWINAPERAFPVAIDPTVTSTTSYTSDTFVQPSYPNNCYGSSTAMRIGSTSQISFIKSSGMPILPTGATIVDGRVHFAYDFNTSLSGSMNITAHIATRDWSETSTTWNTLSLNGTDTTLGLSQAIASATLASASSYPQWTDVCITSAVQSWYNGSILADNFNYGVGLKYSSGNFLQVILKTKNAANGYTPYFTVSYYISNGVCALYNFDTSRYLKVGNPLMSGQTSYDPSARDSLFKIAYRPATDDYVIRSMVNNEFVVYHNLSMHKPLSESATANGVTVPDANLGGSFVWKIGTHPSYPDGSRFAIWNVSGGQNYYLAAEMTVYGCSIKFTTSVSDPGTSWDFIDEYDTSMRGVVLSGQSVQYMIPGETIDFDYYMYDYRPGVNGPVSYAIYDTNWGPSTLATVNSTTGVCTANGVGTFRLGVTYPNAPCTWGYNITIEKSVEGNYYLKNGEATLFVQAPTDLSQNTGSYGGTMTARVLSGEEYQHWNVSYCGNGCYTIASLANDRFAVTVPSGYESSSSISLTLLPFSPSNDNQKWRFIPTNNGRYKITALSANNYSLVFDLQSNSSSPGTAIIQGAWESNNNYDEWYLVPYETALLMGFDELYDSNDGYWYGTRKQLQNPNDETIIAVKTAHFDCSPSEMIAYMQSCDILFVMTHGFEHSIQISKTGSSSWLTTYDLNNVDLSNLKLAVFLACYAGAPFYSPINFIQKVNNCGAETVVGFSDQVAEGDLDEFAEVFSKLLMKGFTCGEAIDRIKNPYSYYNPFDPDSILWIPPIDGTGFLARIEFVGNSNLTLPHN